MVTFINTREDMLIGDSYFFDHTGAHRSDWRAYKNAFCARPAEYGFKISEMYKQYYYMANGIASDEYLSCDVYFYYIVPALNRWNFAPAYGDKNMYSRLFPSIRQPRTVVRNMGGKFYLPDYGVIPESEAVTLVLSEKSSLIIKPAVGTSDGNGVALIDSSDIPKECIKNIFSSYGENFIVQERIRQHEKLALFNESSVNTMRIFTYRGLSGKCEVLRAMLRFGAKGRVNDNAATGGGGIYLLVQMVLSQVILCAMSVWSLSYYHTKLSCRATQKPLGCAFRCTRCFRILTSSGGTVR